jgi:hypothetical protein
MLSNIKVEKIDNTIVVSAMNYRRNMFVTVTDYDLNKKGGFI